MGPSVSESSGLQERGSLHIRGTRGALLTATVLFIACLNPGSSRAGARETYLPIACVVWTSLRGGPEDSPAYSTVDSVPCPLRLLSLPNVPGC